MAFHSLSRAGAWLPAVVAVLVGSSARADLRDYVARPEPEFAWKLKEKIERPEGTIYDLHLVSQVWQGIRWEHQLQVYQPKGTEPTATMFLWNTGGTASPRNLGLALEMAKRMKAPIAFLYGIPNQPLLDGKKEDALIAETFVRYLKTKDESWPLLFPMVKSCVKAMDALQAFSKQEWKQPVTHFVLSGGSKRGWTTWLTAAVEPRIKAIAPAVIDTLNMQAQMPHQLETLGGYSEMIADYTHANLVPMPDTPEAKRLWSMVDPWMYRAKLTMPKIVLCGANDPYWSTDALNLYWDDLKGDKWLLYVPNAGHDLVQKGPAGVPDLSRVLNALGAYVRCQTLDKPLPKLAWKHDDALGKQRVTVTADVPPVGCRLWVAQAPTKDFRKAKWEEKPAQLDKSGLVVGTVDPPTTGCQAFFAELDYEIDGMPYKLSTQMRVSGTPGK